MECQTWRAARKPSNVTEELEGGDILTTARPGLAEDHARGAFEASLRAASSPTSRHVSGTWFAPAALSVSLLADEKIPSGVPHRRAAIHAHAVSRRHGGGKATVMAVI
jgi:hypothetical protein